MLKIIINFQQTALRVNSPGLLLETEYKTVLSFSISFRPLDQTTNTHMELSFAFAPSLSVLRVKN